MAKPQQTEIPLSGKGVERVKIAARDEAVPANVRMKEAKTKVVDLFHNNEETLMGDDGVLRYHHDGKIVKLIPAKEKIKFEDSDEEEIEE